MLGRAGNQINPNINLTQMGSNGTHKNKTHFEKEKKKKVNIRIGKCIWKNRQNAQCMRIWCILAHYCSLLRNRNSD